MKRLLASLVMLLAFSLYAQQPTRMQGHSSSDSPLNPLNYGLREAKDGKERYAALLACHRDAVDNHRPLSYAGIDTIWLDIPEMPESLPLPYNTDFAGAVLVVNNRSGKRATLFTMPGESEAAPLKIDKALIDGNDFRSVPEFRTGDHLLIVNDRSPWSFIVGQRTPVYRSDLILIEEGHAMNNPIVSYASEDAQPECTFVPVTKDLKSIENVTIIRERKSKHMILCFKVFNQNNVLMNNIHIVTQCGKQTGDQAITVVNSANCTFSDITVDSTYSATNAFGFAFSISNAVNCSFENIKVVSAWSPLELYCMNNTTFKNSSVNRFDILCYARDVNITGCAFSKKSIQFSSLFGDLVIDGCSFDDCEAVSIRSTYNAYTPFDLHFRNCTMDISRDNNAVVDVMLHATTPNFRTELKDRCWPNIHIENLTVNMKKSAKRLDIIAPTGNVRLVDTPVDYLQQITVNGLRTFSKGRPAKCDLYYSRHHIKTVKDFKIESHNVELSGGSIQDYINK